MGLFFEFVSVCSGLWTEFHLVGYFGAEIGFGQTARVESDLGSGFPFAKHSALYDNQFPSHYQTKSDTFLRLFERIFL